MQTFVPFPDLAASVAVLDDRRLGKQRVEVFQVLRALTWPAYAWKNHPAVRMWRGFVPGLVAYGVACCDEWTRRGYADAVRPQLLAWSAGAEPVDPDLPPWWGVEELHRSHRAALVRKDPDHYLPVLGPQPGPSDYLWPPAVFPRWPLPRTAVGVDDAADALGLPGPHPWQRTAVTALRSGRDVLAVVAPGAGGRTLGLLAGLSTDGPVLWREPRAGTPAAGVPALPQVPWRDVASGPTAPVLARDPSPEDLLAMAEESRPTGWRFAVPEAPPAAAALVVDLVSARGWPGALRRTTERSGGRPDAPVLVVAERADADERARLVAQHALHDPLRVGAGWDPGGWLGALAVTDRSRRDAVVDLVRAHSPALVRVSSRDRADRLVTLLAAHGLRAASWDPSMRASRASAAIAAWRSRRLHALVAATGEPPLGRVPPALLLHADALASAEQWRAAATGAARAVVLVGRDAPADLTALALARCVRSALLEPCGEPVAVPCGACSACDPARPCSAPPRAVSSGAAAARSAPG